MRTIFRNNYTPVMGEYHERYVIDEARHKSYLFDCDGVFNELPYVYVANEKGQSEEYAVSQKLFTDEVTKLADDIDYEAAARAAADIELGEAIDKETSDREDADTDLQNQIDLIKASSDVVDVVGTYADLQAYDTTKLNDNDIVKVLDDETRDDDITYYRWNTSTQAFTFVGALSAYYSKDETDTLLAGKQDTLTAGTNIQINDNVISATDTTYSDFTGTDGTTAGAAGLVPAPAVGDEVKYLAGDGTWKTVNTSSVTMFYSDFDSSASTVYSDSALTTAAKGEDIESAFNRGKVIFCYKSSAGDHYAEAVGLRYDSNNASYIRIEMATDYDGKMFVFGYDNKTTTSCYMFLRTFQKKLTAGSNISLTNTIDGQKISATNTTYSNFVGTDGTTAGAAGLVPAPATTDAGKYLKADGTWAAISVPTVTLYSDIGQNTDGAMTQKAVSDSLFVNSDRTRIKISDNTSSNNASGDIVIGHSGVAAYTAGSIAIGMYGTTAGTSGATTGSNTAIGMNSVRAIGGYSTALGNSGVTASGNGSTAIGALGVTASADRSVAIGYGNTFATHSDSVALGSNSTTGRTNELSIGTPADSANPEKTRYIAHVTAGVNDTDAVNKKQLDDAIAGVPSASNINSTDWSGLWQ